MSDDETFEITCSKCGEEDTIPFEPTRGEAVYCHDCYVADQREKERRERNAPRKKHGTRVSLQIECAACGKEAELDYMPRGKSLDELLCSDCFDQGEAGDRWREIRQHKRDERKDEWLFDCDECGRTDVLNFKPEPDEEYLCTRCFYNHAEPEPERVEEKEEIGEGVYIREDDGT
jgi:CxxC-x17-CxxC domain-containing protein